MIRIIIGFVTGLTLGVIVGVVGLNVYIMRVDFGANTLRMVLKEKIEVACEKIVPSQYTDADFISKTLLLDKSHMLRLPSIVTTLQKEENKQAVAIEIQRATEEYNMLTSSYPSIASSTKFYTEKEIEEVYKAYPGTPKEQEELMFMERFKATLKVQESAWEDALEISRDEKIKSLYTTFKEKEDQIFNLLQRK